MSLVLDDVEFEAIDKPPNGDLKYIPIYEYGAQKRSARYLRDIYSTVNIHRND